MNKSQFNVNQYNVLKTFVKGETIEFKVENKPRSATFIHVSHRGILTIADENGNEEEIELNKITSITL
jgi:hypothetical protein